MNVARTRVYRDRETGLWTAKGVVPELGPVTFTHRTWRAAMVMAETIEAVKAYRAVQ